MKIPIKYRAKVRELSGLSLKGRNEATDISDSRLSRWEHGQADLLTGELRLIRDTLLAVSGRNHLQVRRLLGLVPAARGELRPHRVEATSRNQRSELRGK